MPPARNPKCLTNLEEESFPIDAPPGNKHTPQGRTYDVLFGGGGGGGDGGGDVGISLGKL